MKTIDTTIFYISLLLIVILVPIYSYGDTVMQPIHRLNKASIKQLNPVIYPTKKTKIEGLFDIPIDNTIASNKIGNSITLIQFNGDKIKYKTLRKNFLDYVSSGNDGYMPIFSNNFIGYSLGRGFLLYNINNNNFNYYSIVGNFNYKIGSINALDPEKNIFIFAIYDLREKDPTFLRVMDLNEASAKTLLDKETGDCNLEVLNKNIFIYHDSDLYALNSDFEKTDHPLVTIYNTQKNKDFGSIDELLIHPLFPFAIIKEKKYDSSYNYTISIWLVTWREDIDQDKPKMVKLLSEDSFAYSFSYDGKWLCFIDSSASPRGFMMMPVDPELPYYIGEPIFLGEAPRPENSNGGAMTRNPSGLVMSECEGYKGKCWLKKWDFTEAEKLIEKKK